MYAATASDVGAGNPVLFIPEHLILSSNKAMNELRCANGEMVQAEEFVRSKGAEVHARQWYLMLKLLVEIQKGRDSMWYGWLNSLPRYYENAPAMTGELTVLRYLLFDGICV